MASGRQSRRSSTDGCVVPLSSWEQMNNAPNFAVMFQVSRIFSISFQHGCLLSLLALDLFGSVCWGALYGRLRRAMSLDHGERSAPERSQFCIDGFGSDRFDWFDGLDRFWFYKVYLFILPECSPCAAAAVPWASFAVIHSANVDNETGADAGGLSFHPTETQLTCFIS